MKTNIARTCDTPNHVAALVATESFRHDRRHQQHALRHREFAACLPALRRWTLRRFARCDIHDADDLVQIALLRALRRIDAFEVRSDGCFLAYLRQIVLNEVRRQSQCQRRRGEDVSIDESLHDEHDPAFDAAQDNEHRRRYARALRRLNRRQRTHIVLRVEHGMSFNEIAHEIGGSADGARMIVARALRALKAQLTAN